MGFPKALLEFDGKKAVEKILAACRGAGIQKPIVVLGAHAEEIQRKAELCSAQVVLNADWPKGQTSSVKTGVQELNRATSWFLVWPVDLPLVPLDVLHQLLAATPENSSKRILVPTYRGRRGHPVRFHVSLEEEILALENEEPLHNLIRREPTRVQEVPVSSETVLRDFDRPEDVSPLF